MKPILEVNNVSKRFKVGQAASGYLSFRERIVNALRTSSAQRDFWALNDVSFDVSEGDCVAIIGRNGAGKSTLLKILSKITPPTSGKVTIRGRMASLLEVGTGFHPELTGRENIFFNGSLLGMKRREVQNRFNDIVDFSGTSEFLDTPLKHYSSGMQLRLAFSVAAFLNPEIMIIDEVLAVGDAEFQKKCLGKMNDVSRSGRTILFVSHNMAAVQSICSKAVVLNRGQVQDSGPVMKMIERYNASLSDSEVIQFREQDIYLSKFSATSTFGGIMKTYEAGKFTLTVIAKKEYRNCYIGIGVNDMYGVRLFTLFSRFNSHPYQVRAGTNEFICEIPNVQLKPGSYFAEIYIGDGAATAYVYYNHNLRFDIEPSDKVDFAKIPDYSQGHFLINQEWK